MSSTKPGDVQKEDGSEGKTAMSLAGKIKFVLTHITVEPMLLLYILPSAMSMIATQNLNLEKACRVNLHMDESICDAMASRNQTAYNETDEIVVQKLVASMNAWKNGIQSLIPSLLLMFIGSWSDRHKRRKPCILIPVFGEIVSCIGLLVATYYFYELPIEFVVFIEAVPPSILGGWASAFAAIFSYISNISSVESRTLRIGAVNLFLNVSWTIGIAFSGILYKKTGFYGVFSIALVMYVVCITYGYLRVKEIPVGDDGKIEQQNEDCEEVQQQQQDEEVAEKKKVGFLKDFFDWKHIRDTFRVAFKKQGRNRRARICTIMILAIIIIGPLHGEWNILYLFTRYKFGWNGVDFSTYTAFAVISNACGTLFSLTFFSKFLKVDDAILGLVSVTSKIAACFVFAFAPNSLVFYSGSLVELLNGTSFIALRSIMSKLVAPDEIGKIYSLFGVSEAIVPLIYGPLYSIVYKYTINVMPGAFFLVGGALTSPALFIFLWLYFENKKDIKDANKAQAQEESLLKKNKDETNQADENGV